MEKIAIEQLPALLRKPVNQCSESEIKFLFHILCLDLKEYRQKSDFVSFEIHFQRTYILRVRVDHGLHFTNEWVNWGECCGGVAMGAPKNINEVIVLFVNMFGQSLLANTDYEVTYNEEESLFESQEEAAEYLTAFQSIAQEILRESKTE